MARRVWPSVPVSARPVLPGCSSPLLTLLPDFCSLSLFCARRGLALVLFFLCIAVAIGGGLGYTACITQANQAVDRQITSYLATLTACSGGCTFTLITSFTQFCKPKGARTYRGLCIAPPGASAYQGQAGAYATGYSGVAMPMATATAMPMATAVGTPMPMGTAVAVPVQATAVAMPMA